jgi:hypothetical protein
VQLLRQLVQHRHQHLSLQQPLIPEDLTVTTPARAADPAAPTAHATLARESVTCPPAGLGMTAEAALKRIAHLANELCEHLTDNQWRLAAQIRDLAETARPTAGAS